MLYNFYGLSALVASLACFFISFLTWFKLERASPHRWYPVTVLGIGFWCVDSFFVSAGFASDKFYLFHRMLYLGAFLSQVAFVLWAHAIRQSRTVFQSVLVYSLVGANVILAIDNFSGRFYYGIDPLHFYAPCFIPGVDYWLFPLTCLACCCVGTWLMYLEMRGSSGFSRIQLTYIIAICLLMYIGGGFYFLFVYGYRIPPLSKIFVVVSNATMAYAILRHHLLDVRVFIKRTIVFAGLFIVVFGTIVGLAYVSQDLSQSAIRILAARSDFQQMGGGPLFYQASLAVAALYTFVVGLYVYLRNQQSPINRTFLSYYFVLTLWVFGCFCESVCVTSCAALLADRLLYTGCILAAPTYLYFCYVVTKRPINRYLFWLIAVSTLGWLAVNYSGLRTYFIVDVVKNYPFRYIAVPGPLWPYFMAWFNVQVVWFLVVLVNNYRRQTGIERVRAGYLFLATLIMIAASSFYFLLLIGFLSPAIDAYLLIVYGSVMAYAILRHQLLDITVIIRKTLVFAGLFAFVYAVFAIIAYLAQTTFQDIAGLNRWMAMIPSVLVIIFTLKPLERFLLNITDRFLFQKKYDYKELLKAFSEEVLTVLDLDKLTKITTSKLSDIIKLETCQCTILDEKEVAITPKTYQKTDGTLTIPLMMHDKPLAILILGKKKSDEDYTQDDLDILLPLAKALSIAIANAKLFEELAKAQQEVAQKEKMATIGTLAAGMAHEIRNPIMTMKIFSDHLPEKLNDDAFLNKYRNIVIGQVDKIDHVIQAMVDFTSESVGIQEAVDLEKVIDDLIGLVGLSMDTAGRVEITKDLPADMPKILFNRSELDEILLNLTQNAIQAMAGKGRVSFKAREVAGAVELEISDTGCGMPEEIMRNVFSPFFTTRAKGFGLGLFVVNELIRRNGASISVDSKVGQGTRFKLRLLSD